MNNGLLIAFIAVLAFFAVFMIATYFILRKTFKFNIDKNEIVIKKMQVLTLRYLLTRGL